MEQVFFGWLGCQGLIAKMGIVWCDVPSGVQGDKKLKSLQIKGSNP